MHLCLTLLIGLHFAHKASSSDISNDACGLPDPKFPIKTKAEVNQRIWNGHKARVFSFPWAVTLCNPKGLCFCGATIISRDWIVTAAHCLVKIDVAGNPLKEFGYAYAGVIDRQATGHSVQKRKFARVKISRPFSKYNDFALVKLERPFIFNEWVKPICIPWEPPPDHTECIFAGWGTTHPGGYKDRIQMVYYKTYNKAAECLQFTRSYQSPSRTNRLCAGVEDLSDGRYNCQGDSGSGLICKHPEDPGVWFLHGIGSAAFPCTDFSRPRGNYFMKMYNYRDFAEKVTGIKFPALLSVTVSTPDEVYVSLGNDLTLPCSATFEDPSDYVVSMKWINSSNAAEVYRYMLPGAQDPVDSAFPTMVPGFNENDKNRYIRQRLNLVIKNFQVKDAGRKCCEIGAGVHARRRRKSSCTDILWTDPNAFQCVQNPQVSAPLVNGSTVHVTGILDITCQYYNILPRANITFYDKQSRQILAVANGDMADEDNKRYSLAFRNERLIWKSLWLAIDFNGRYLYSTINVYVEQEEAVRVSALSIVAATLGKTLTIPCDFHYSTTDLSFLELYWVEVNDEAVGLSEVTNYYNNYWTVYRYGSNIDAPSTPPWREGEQMSRYKRSNFSLMIRNFQETDRMTKCCQVHVFKRYSNDPSSKRILAGIDEACTVISQNGTVITQNVNIALKKTAWQSSTSNGAIASRAVDGRDSTLWSSDSCTHTFKELNPWWAVDLGASFIMTSVELTNRGDCCNERLSNFKIGISFVNPRIITPISITIRWCHYQSEPLGLGETRSFKCELTGRYVYIIRVNIWDFLTLCEVKVYGTPSETARSLEILNEIHPIDTESGESAEKTPGKIHSPYVIHDPAGLSSVKGDVIPEEEINVSRSGIDNSMKHVSDDANTQSDAANAESGAVKAQSTRYPVTVGVCSATVICIIIIIVAVVHTQRQKKTDDHTGKLT